MNENNPRKTVSVGIPAYNEEENIGRLLKSLLDQKLDGYELLEILVVSDGSSDGTQSIVQSFSEHEAKVKLIASEVRQGVATSLNILLEQATGDVFILLNADVLPHNEKTLWNLVKPIASEKADIASGILNELPAKNFFESLLIQGMKFKKQVFSSYKNGANAMTCFGPARAFSKPLYKTMRFEPSVADDIYSYLYAKVKGFTYAWVPEAIVDYRQPDNFADYYKQSKRFQTSQEKLKQFFPEQVIVEEMALPKLLMIKLLLYHTFKSPIKMSGYVTIIVISLLKTYFGENKTFTDSWDISTSSKKLN